MRTSERERGVSTSKNKELGRNSSFFIKLIGKVKKGVDK
jgi:hypothetical protein